MYPSERISSDTADESYLRVVKDVALTGLLGLHLYYFIGASRGELTQIGKSSR